MNKRKTAITAVLFAALTYSFNTYAIKTNTTVADLEIRFEQTESYSDVDTGLGLGESSLAAIIESATAAFQKEANKYLPNGYSLEIVVTNIDLAGDRSMMSSTYGDIRVYSDIYPPRINFEYAIYDAQERLISKGTEKATDLTYMLNLRGARTWSEEEAPYLTELVRGWASTKLRRAVNQE